MAGHIVQYMAECKAHAVALLPDGKAYWFPILQLAMVRSIEVTPAAVDGRFQWPSADGGLKRRLRMIAYEMGFLCWG